jgi:multicomponent Na+:H+ antiporter subunit C
METVLAVVCGVLVAGSIYLMLSHNFIRFLFGLIMLSNSVNLIIFTSGGLTRGAAALIPKGQTLPDPDIANALPQALILTAIVIGFGLLAFALVLAYRVQRSLGTVDTDTISLAYREPEEEEKSS